MRLKTFISLLSAVVLGLSAAAFAPIQATAAADLQVSPPIPACPGAPASHLVTGEFARVTPGTPDNVRNKPTKAGEQVTQISPGEMVLITGTPTCADNYLWWPVYTQSGFEGWVAEGNTATYFLDATTSPLIHLTVSAGGDTALTYDKFSLTYPAPLAKQLSSNVSATTVVSFAGIPNSGAGPQPEHATFLFGTINRNNLFNYASLSIYKVDAVNQLGGSPAQVIATLRNLIGTQAAVPQSTSIQVFPSVMAGQVFHARTGYLKFKGGSGIRFVPYYAQDVDVIKADRLSYTFMGLSDDGQYYLVATIPISTVALQSNDKAMPNLNDPNIATAYPAYVTQTIARLEQANAADFAPNLADLDMLMQSIAIR
jgi:hypothetical protein